MASLAWFRSITGGLWDHVAALCIYRSMQGKHSFCTTGCYALRRTSIFVTTVSALGACKQEVDLTFKET